MLVEIKSFITNQFFFILLFYKKDVKVKIFNFYKM